ncbi:MAG: ubiquitin-like domain-containing protein [Candidatus Hodarchaeales archaeon]|jgi:hypothetical protein
MKIKVVSAIGGGEEILSVMADNLVRDVKQMIAENKRIPADTVIIVFRGQQLDDGQTLVQAGVADGDKLYLITRTVGG